MEILNLLELIGKTEAALIDAGATKYYQRVFKQVYKQLLIYAAKTETNTFTMDFGLQFLEEHYSLTERTTAHKWAVIYSRCINELADYQRTGYVVCYKGKGALQNSACKKRGAQATQQGCPRSSFALESMCEKES